MLPLSNSCSPAMVLINVDFPAPLGPRSPNMPFPTSKVTSFKASTLLEYVLETFFIDNCINTPFTRR